MWIVIHYYKWQQSWWSPASYAWYIFFFYTCISYDLGEGATLRVSHRHLHSFCFDCLLLHKDCLFCCDSGDVCVFFWPSSFTIGCDSKWCVLEGECSVTFVYWFCVWGICPTEAGLCSTADVPSKAGKFPHKTVNKGDRVFTLQVHIISNHSLW